jgi:hypothetical protein
MMGEEYVSGTGFMSPFLPKIEFQMHVTESGQAIVDWKHQNDIIPR